VTDGGRPRSDEPQYNLVARAQAAMDRYDRTGEALHLRDASMSWDAVIRSSNPGPLDSTASRWWIEAASALILYAEVARAPELLNRATELLWQVIGVESEPATVGAAKSNLGCALECTYRRSGRQQELDQAIDCFGYGGASAVDGDERTGRAVEVAARHNIASALATRYSHTGRLDDLQESIRWIGLAVLAVDAAGTTSGDEVRHHLLIPAVPGRALLLATASTTPQITSARAAFDAQLHGSLTAAVVYTTAAALHREWSRRKGSRSDLEHMRDLLQAWRSWVDQLHPFIPGSPARLGVIFELGTVSRDLFRLGRDDADLDFALSCFDQANADEFAWVPGWPRRVSALAECLLFRHDKGDAPESLQRAMLILGVALGQIPQQSPERAEPQRWLAGCLRRRYEDRGYPADLARAVDSYREAVRLGVEGAPQETLAAAQEWAGWAARRGGWRESAEPYTAALRTAETLYRRQLLGPEKEWLLLESADLGAQAAYALSSADRQIEAVAALEMSRARLLAEALETRSAQARELGKTQPELYDRYAAAVARLRMATSRVSGNNS
jgi:hypothetical protein